MFYFLYFFNSIHCFLTIIRTKSYQPIKENLYIKILKIIYHLSAKRNFYSSNCWVEFSITNIKRDSIHKIIKLKSLSYLVFLLNFYKFNFLPFKFIYFNLFKFHDGLHIAWFGSFSAATCVGAKETCLTPASLYLYRRLVLRLYT